MPNTKTVENQGPKSVEHERSDQQSGRHASDQQDGSDQAGSDQSGGRPGHGQSGGGTKGKSPIAVIAGQDGPQTGVNERGNPGVGG